MPSNENSILFSYSYLKREIYPVESTRNITSIKAIRDTHVITLLCPFQRPTSGSVSSGQVVMFLLQRASKKCSQWSAFLQDDGDCFWQATQENLTCLLGQGQRMLNHCVKTGLKLISMVLY